MHNFDIIDCDAHDKCTVQYLRFWMADNWPWRYRPTQCTVSREHRSVSCRASRYRRVLRPLAEKWLHSLRMRWRRNTLSRMDTNTLQRLVRFDYCVQYCRVNKQLCILSLGLWYGLCLLSNMAVFTWCRTRSIFYSIWLHFKMKVITFKVKSSWILPLTFVIFIVIAWRY